MAIHCNRRVGVDRYTSHVIFSHAPCTSDHTHIVARGVSGAHSFHPHAIHDVTCLSVRCWSSFCPPFSLSLTSTFSLSLSTCPQLPQCRHRRGLKPLHITHNEEYCPVAIYNPLTPEPQKASESFARYAAKLCKMKESVVSPFLIRSCSKDWKSKIWGSQSSKCYTDNTRCTEQFGRSTTQDMGGWPRVCSYKENIQGRKRSARSIPTTCRRQHRNWPQLWARHRRASRKLQWQYTMLLIRRLLHQLKVQEDNGKVSDCGGPKKRETEAIVIDKWPSTSQKLENSFHQRRLSFCAISQSRYAMDWWSWEC